MAYGLKACSCHPLRRLLNGTGRSPSLILNWVVNLLLSRLHGTWLYLYVPCSLDRLIMYDSCYHYSKSFNNYMIYPFNRFKLSKLHSRFGRLKEEKRILFSARLCLHQILYICWYGMPITSRKIFLRSESGLWMLRLVKLAKILNICF